MNIIPGEVDTSSTSLLEGGHHVLCLGTSHRKHASETTLEARRVESAEGYSFSSARPVPVDGSLFLDQRLVAHLLDLKKRS